jgi:hypothetical protein
MNLNQLVEKMIGNGSEFLRFFLKKGEYFEVVESVAVAVRRHMLVCV